MNRALLYTIFCVFSVSLLGSVFVYRNKLTHGVQQVVTYRDRTLNRIPQPTATAYPTPTPMLDEPLSHNSDTSINPEEQIEPTIIYTDPEDALPWGVAQKVDDVTYTIRVGNDERMGTPQEIFNALNEYRQVNNVNGLKWDQTLASYAQSRADYFKEIEGTDKHAGFDDYLENGNGFEELGYRRVGENSYFGGRLSGTHLIEWVFSQSPGHNANQLDPEWEHVGIGVTDTSVNLIFAKGNL